MWELGVEETHRRSGIGIQLVEALCRQGKDAGLRIIVCETQNTNVSAIEFYRKTGFELDGVDLSYYTNTDMTTGEVAFFMKKKLE
jgi:ribosomal protein S18 acetylase RimI-like enzyme